MARNEALAPFFSTDDKCGRLLPHLDTKDTDVEELHRLQLLDLDTNEINVEDVIRTFPGFRFYRGLARHGRIAWAVLVAGMVLALVTVASNMNDVYAQGRADANATLLMYVFHAGVFLLVPMLVRTIHVTTVASGGALSVLVDHRYPLTDQALANLIRWRCVYGVVGVIWTGLLLAGVVCHDAAPTILSAAIIALILTAFYWAILVPWIFGLQVGAALAAAPVDAVIKVLEDKRTCGMTDQEWQDSVCTPVRNLCEDTLPKLTTWGTSVTCVILAAVLAAFGLLVEAMFANWSMGYCGAAFDAVLFPLMIAAIPAAVSTKCVALKGSLNRLRFANLGGASIYGDSVVVDSTSLHYTFSKLSGSRLDSRLKTEIPALSSASVDVLHVRISAVEQYIANQNKGAGLGFVIGGTVLTTSKLLKVAAIFGGSAGSVVAGLQWVVQRLAVGAHGAKTSQIMCALSMEQQHIINDALNSANVSGSASMCKLLADATGIVGVST